MRRFQYAVLAIVLIAFVVEGAIRVKAKLLREGLIFEAFREAPISGIWLGLYNNHHFNFGYFSFWGMRVEAIGSYQIKQDTLILRANSETESATFKKDVSFLILENALKELPDSSGDVGYLENGKEQPKLFQLTKR